MQTTPILLCMIVLCVVGCQSESEVDPVVQDRDIKAVMESHVDELMAIPGVTAVGIGATEDGTPCLKIYVIEQSEESKSRIPERLEGHPIVVEVSGEIKPMDGD